MKHLFSAILAILILGCDTDGKDSSTYFGGKIINPKSNFVLFLKDDKIIDTIALDKKNRFMANYRDFEEGLYTFKHGAEFQYIYLQPKDSLLVRLNTWDFDESLVFSGIGSSRNEYLIKLFLQNEKEEKALYNYFNLPEEKFQEKIDEVIAKKLKNFEEFSNNETDISDGFKKLTDAAIYYPLYRLKEVYPYYYKKAHDLENFAHVSDSYYDYRTNVNVNDGSLIAFYPYQNYLVSHMHNLSEQAMNSDGQKSDNPTVTVMHSIIDHIDHEEIKNTLLRRIVVSDFFKSTATCTINEEAFGLFLDHCTNPEFVNLVKNLAFDSQAVANNEPLNDFTLLSYNNMICSVSEEIEGKNSVLYFWSTTFQSSSYILKNIKYLEKKYPHIQFIGINLQTSFEDIRNEPNLKKLNIKRQFKLPEDSEAHSFLTSDYPRLIIIDSEGVVVNGFTYLDPNKLSPDLSKLEKHDFLH